MRRRLRKKILNATNYLFLANLHYLHNLLNMNEMKTKRLRQADIAAMAGVSVSTVSRVLANEPGISESVRQHILKVAAENGYSARTTSGPLRGTLALIASDGVTGGLSVFYEGIVDGLRAGLRERGFELREHETFRPHVTLVRDVARGPAAASGIAPVQWLVESFALVESQVGQRGSEYTVLDRWLLT